MFNLKKKLFDSGFTVAIGQCPKKETLIIFNTSTQFQCNTNAAVNVYWMGTTRESNQIE